MVSASGRRDFIVRMVLDTILYNRNENGQPTKNLQVPEEVQKTALDIYRRASERGLVRGRSIDVVISASLYAAIRIHKAPQTLDDIARNAAPKKKTIGRMYRLLVKELGLEAVPINSEDAVAKLARELKLKDATREDAIELLKRADRRGLMSGRNPMSVVAAVVYHAALKHDEKLTQRSISIATGVTEATIRNRNRELEEKLGLEKRPRHPADVRAARKRREAALREQARS